VNWSRDETWANIAGKVSAKGKFSPGGTKETAYAVYAALTDSNSERYAQIRASVARAA
jgi:hypothetical protein